MALSATAKREILRQECHASFPYLIEITDNSDGTVYRYSNTDDDVTVTIDGEEKTFSAITFGISFPDVTESKVGNGTFTLYDSVLTWIPKIRSTSERFSIRFLAEIYYSEDGETWQYETIDDSNFKLTECSWSDDSVISWTLVFDEDMDVLMPIDKMTTLVCPAIV